MRTAPNPTDRTMESKSPAKRKRSAEDRKTIFSTLFLLFCIL